MNSFVEGEYMTLPLNALNVLSLLHYRVYEYGMISLKFFKSRQSVCCILFIYYYDSIRVGQILSPCIFSKMEQFSLIINRVAQ